MILLNLVILIAIIGLLWWVTTKLPLPAPLPEFIRVIAIIAAILVLLTPFGFNPLSFPRLV